MMRQTVDMRGLMRRIPRVAPPLLQPSAEQWRALYDESYAAMKQRVDEIWPTRSSSTAAAAASTSRGRFLSGPSVSITPSRRGVSIATPSASTCTLAEFNSCRSHSTRTVSESESGAAADEFLNDAEESEDVKMMPLSPPRQPAAGGVHRPALGALTANKSPAAVRPNSSQFSKVCAFSFSSPSPVGWGGYRSEVVECTAAV